MLIIPERVLSNWQDMVNIMADLAAIPAGLIMRIDDDDIEVFIASSGNNNPYKPGDRERLRNSGLYCETVINKRQPLHITDALSDPKWRNNPDISLNMISYLGFPILNPDNTPFGTICILDSKPNPHSETIIRLLEKFRDMIQTHIELSYMNTVLGEKNRRFSDYLEELQSLRGLIPICAKCKRIKTREGYWKSVEEYLTKHPDADFSHGYCPDCYQKELDELSNT